MNNLKVAALPLNITWGDVAENLYATELLLQQLPKDTDLVVLPELFTTGFLNTTELLAKHSETVENSKSLDKLRLWARNYNFAIAGSLLVKHGEGFVNRGFFIEPSGEETFYDKRHLFCLSAESRLFESGEEEMPVARFRGWNIALAVCYDLRFPVWLRNKDCRYDLLVIPANWPNSRQYAWKHLLIARAIENQAFVIGTNRSGKDDDGEYNDSTFIFNYLGKPVESTAVDNSNILTATLDGNKMTAFRNRFPAWRDADKFVLR